MAQTGDLGFCECRASRPRQFTCDCSWRLAGKRAVEFQNGRFRRYRASKGGQSRPLGQKQKLNVLRNPAIAPDFELIPSALPSGARSSATWSFLPPLPARANEKGVDHMIGSRDFKRQNISLAKLPLRLWFADMPSGGFGTYPTAPSHIVFALEGPRGAFALQLQHTAVPAFGLFA